MPQPDEIRWVKSTANELNNLLQVISESSLQLENLCVSTTETDKYFAILRNGLERATQVTRIMVDRVGGYTPESAAAPIQPDIAAVPSIAPLDDVEIHNPTGPKELVMIVDDEEFVTMLAAHVLSDEGYRVLTAGDGFRALDLYRRFGAQISLILLDFTMPVMDGSDVFNELLQLDPNVPVVLSSGFAEHDRLRGMLAKGLRGFIPKPYTQEKLLAQIRSTLDALRAERTGERRVL